ncbi:MAG: SRPBCC domain-containing protein [Gallicola sp.]|nr:SRPBCC domain-containing protein [Gallicola sp.]
MNNKIIVVEVLVEETLDDVWDKWTNPDHILHWNQASEQWQTETAENDLRKGGKFSYRMSAKDGSASFDFDGIYTLVIEKEVLQYNLSDGRKVCMEFIETDNGTRVIQEFEAEETMPRDLQEEGWQNILKSFKSYVEESKNNKI